MAGGVRQPFHRMIVDSRLNDGTAVRLRQITPADEARLRKGISQMSAESRYLRFFSPTPMPPDNVVEKLVDVDGHDHIAWGAICSECDGEPAIGAVHALRHPGHSPIGEYSVAVLDAFHGLGLARMLTAALLINCHAEGFTALDVHILSENRAASRLVQWLGGTAKAGTGVVAEYSLDIPHAIATLNADQSTPGVQHVLAALADTC